MLAPGTLKQPGGGLYCVASLSKPQTTCQKQERTQEPHFAPLTRDKRSVPEWAHSIIGSRHVHHRPTDMLWELLHLRRAIISQDDLQGNQVVLGTPDLQIVCSRPDD